jgi:TIR domain
MADILVSYTSCDRAWAHWIAQELEAIGHTPRVHEWEISGGGDIAAWMEERHQKAGHILCVVSKAYLAAPYSSWERRAAQWASQSTRAGFALPVRVEDCEVPTLMAHIKSCDLFDTDEQEARARLIAFLTRAAKPTERPLFPGGTTSLRSSKPPEAAPIFPGKAAVPFQKEVVATYIGRDFRDRVCALLRATGMTVRTDVRIMHKVVDILAEDRYFGRTINYAIECKLSAQALSKSAVATIVSECFGLLESGLVDEVWIVAVKLTADARAFVENQRRDVRAFTIAELEHLVRREER